MQHKVREIIYLYLLITQARFPQRVLSLRSHGPEPARLLCPWNFPGKNTGVVAILSSSEFPNSGMKPMSPANPALQVDSLSLSQTHTVFLQGYEVDNTGCFWGGILGD